MRPSGWLTPLRDISIAKKLYFIVGTMAVLIVLELFTLWFAVHTLSSVRAFVGAEGLWSKAQKDAIYSLSRYYRTHDDTDYRKFLRFMVVPLGDHKTRLELLKQDPDYAIARHGFLEGRVHPDDIDGMIKLVRRFHGIYYINKAINIWSEADSVIARMLTVSEQLHHEIQSGAPSKQKLDELIAELDPINQRLTVQEDNFSYTLGEGSRWLEHLILSLLFAMALTVEITGLVLTISVTMGITKGLNEINRATAKIAKGDLSERAVVFSRDEIGSVAATVNQMTEQLTLSNKELEQFAYVASHDLQEPLRMVSSYVELLAHRYRGRLDDDADEFIGYAADGAKRMQALLTDLLSCARIGTQTPAVKPVDLEMVLERALDNLQLTIEESGAEVTHGELPTLPGDEGQMVQLLQNLIANALKFRGLDPPRVAVRAERNGAQWLVSVHDNGIGMDMQFAERIFVIFQRLHTRTEFAGTGIGLAICKKIVERHGGRIWVESHPGKGATFFFTLAAG